MESGPKSTHQKENVSAGVTRRDDRRTPGDDIAAFGSPQKSLVAVLHRHDCAIGGRAVDQTRVYTPEHEKPRLAKVREPRTHANQNWRSSTNDVLAPITKRD